MPDEPVTRSASQPAGRLLDRPPTAPPGQRLAQRLDAARERAFVGREHEQRVLAAALAGGPDAPRVVHVHGPGGIGKSTLLRRFVARARTAGRPVVELDARSVGPSAAALEDAGARALVDPRCVLVVDSLEHGPWLEGWLRERFLPRLPDDVLVVLAGRTPPDVEWRVDPGWAGAVTALALGPLGPGTSAALLTAAGLDEAGHGAVLGFAGGNPLVLSLAAAVVRGEGAQPREWRPSGDVLAMLLARLVGEVPSPAHRRALEVSAQAYTTTEDLLRATLPDEDAHALFAWLRGLPFVEAVPHGLHPHDAVREALAEDLRWRDPEAFGAVRDRLAQALLRRLRAADERAAISVVGELLFPFRPGGDPSWQREGEVRSGPLTEADVPAVLRLAETAEGPESAAIAAHWVARQPQAFRVYRWPGSDEPVAFSARLHLDAPRTDDLAVDPVVAAAWEHVAATGGVRPGEHVAVTRFAVHPERYQQPSAVMSLVLWETVADISRSTGLAHCICVYRDAEAWGPVCRYWDLADVGARPVVGADAYALYVHDWRQVPFAPWIELIMSPLPERDSVERSRPEPRPVLARAEFDAAVRDALRGWRRRDALASTPLLRTRLVPPGATDPQAALRAVLHATLGGLRADEAGRRGYDAVSALHLAGAPTQESAARRLGVPFSTFRRHLALGVGRLCDALWELEVHGR
ncbi:ATP-binding protein [Cellulomonas cellasea]|uniref:RecA/RadA recombinase n=1 Tax=Cellulomonas cellasea TaxID=43670 RepID=A0A7W4YDK6_9CELL|nr:ATP-binding protein [Cellulomonas cellasea]MBB2925269.1 RecA/RadA recombinase [Cellulomonas cellasea]